MSDTSEKAEEKAGEYREGYYHGARAVLKAIGDGLPEVQMRVLETWVAGPVDQWRHGPPDAAPPPLPMLDGA